MSLFRICVGSAYDVVHYYSTCDGEGPLFRPVEDSQLYNSLMNATYIDMITDNILLGTSCRNEVLITNHS